MVGATKADTKAAEAEAAVQKHYNRLYAQLSMQAQTKYFSGKSLSGKDALFQQTKTEDGVTISAATEDPLLRFAKTQRLSDTLAPRCPWNMANFNGMRMAAEDRAHRSALLGMNAWERHKHFLANVVHYYGRGSGAAAADANPTVKTDFDILQENYRFIRDEADDAPGGWEVNLARKYYAKLFREYCIADLSRYKEGKVGLRWRTEKEVVAGRGQFVCGARGCEQRDGLASFEVNFAYWEAGAQKAALVKLRLCPKHALQLNYQKNQQALMAQKKRRQKEEERAAKNRQSEDGSGTSSKRQRAKSDAVGSAGGSVLAEPSSDVASKQQRGGSAPRSAAAGSDAGSAQRAEPLAVQAPTYGGSTSGEQPERGGVHEDVETFFQGLFE